MKNSLRMTLVISFAFFAVFFTVMATNAYYDGRIAICIANGVCAGVELAAAIFHSIMYGRVQGKLSTSIDDFCYGGILPYETVVVGCDIDDVIKTFSKRAQIFGYMPAAWLVAEKVDGVKSITIFRSYAYALKYVESKGDPPDKIAFYQGVPS